MSIYNKSVRKIHHEIEYTYDDTQSYLPINRLTAAHIMNYRFTQLYFDDFMLI